VFAVCYENPYLCCHNPRRLYALLLKDNREFLQYFLIHLCGFMIFLVFYTAVHFFAEKISHRVSFLCS
jgi:hypothetical protein